MSERIRNIIDLDLRVFKTGDAYTVTAQTPESGLAENKPDPTVIFTEEFQEKLHQIREEPFATDEALFREVGDALFQFLFQGQVRDLFLALWSQHVQSNENSMLRLRLNIDEAAIELAILPWEMMHWQDVFLATQINTLVTRQLLNLDYGNIKSLKVAETPKILIVIPGGSGLNTEAEENAITSALKKASVPFEVLKGTVTLQSLDDALIEGDYAILHFIGHARFAQNEQGEIHGLLRFNDAHKDTATDDGEDWVPETDIQSLLGNHKGLKLVVLNACHTGELSEHPQNRGFWGVIPSLLRAGIPAVVAMQYAIRDDVAAIFGETFYKRLTSGKWAGHVDIAATLARNACFLAYPNDRGFATPALYLRSKDGVIFDISDQLQEESNNVSDIHCKQAPRPPERLLFRYRNLSMEDINARIPVLHKRLRRLSSQIDELKNQSILDERQQWRLNRYEKNRNDLERELDELRDVLAWKRYENCKELRKLVKLVAIKQDEKEALEKAGAYVSYDLKNEIFELNERILRLRDILRTDSATIT